MKGAVEVNADVIGAVSQLIQCEDCKEMFPVFSPKNISDYVCLSCYRKRNGIRDGIESLSFPYLI